MEEKTLIEDKEAQLQGESVDVSRSILGKSAFAAFKYSDFRLLLPGALLSNIGTWIQWSALLWLVRDMTRSETWVGVVNMANFLPVLFFVLYTGSLADRLNRKILILSSQAIMMVSALFLGIFSSLGFLSLALIITFTTINGIAFVFNFPAWRSIVSDLVPGDDLLNGVAWDSASFNMARFLGPAIGAFIVNKMGFSWAFYVNAMSFLAVLGALALTKTKTPGYKLQSGTRRHIFEGIKFVTKNVWARNVLILLAISSFFGVPYIVLLPGLAKDVLHSEVLGFGFLLGATGLGAVIAAPLVSVLGRTFTEKRILKLVTSIFALALLAFSFSRNFALSTFISGILGACYLSISATINSLLQSRVERNFRGRIMSFYILVFQGVFPLGGITFGFLADLTSIPIALLFCGCTITALALVILVFPILDGI